MSSKARRKLLKKRRRYASAAAPRWLVEEIVESARAGIVADMNRPSIGPALSGLMSELGLDKAYNPDRCQDDMANVRDSACAAVLNPDLRRETSGEFSTGNFLVLARARDPLTDPGE